MDTWSEPGTHYTALTPPVIFLFLISMIRLNPSVSGEIPHVAHTRPHSSVTSPCTDGVSDRSWPPEMDWWTCVVMPQTSKASPPGVFARARMVRDVRGCFSYLDSTLLHQLYC